MNQPVTNRATTLRRWGARVGWMTLGALVTCAAITVLPEERPLAGSSSERAVAGPERGEARVLVAPKNERVVRGGAAVGRRDHSLMAILARKGPGFRILERVTDWSAQASADELLVALQGVDDWPALAEEMRPRVIDQLISRLAQLDGAAAPDMARALHELEGAGLDFAQTAYGSWLAEEPEAAIEHALKSRAESSDANFTFFTGLLAQLGETDPDLANTVAETMVWSGNEFLADIAKMRRADLFAEALEGNGTLEFLNEWVAAGRFTAQEIEGLRDRLMRWTINSDGDPRRLAQLMDQGVKVEDDLRWEAVRVLAKGDPERANQFLLEQSDPEMRLEELSALLEVQADLGPAARAAQGGTTDWLISSYHGEDRQTMLLEASRTLMGSDLRLAWRAASAMADDGVKFASTYAVGFDWLAKDPQAARAHLPRELVERYDLIMTLYSAANTGFPPDVKLQLIFSR